MSNPQMLKLKPATTGLLVRKEDNSAMLAAEGEVVALTDYYRRRMLDGDVVVVEDVIAESAIVEPETPAKPKK